MDTFAQDIIQRLNVLCNKYKVLQEYFSKNNIIILQELQQIIENYHNQYDISDICATTFEIKGIDLTKMYAFIYHINNELGFYELLQTYKLDYSKYKELEDEAYEYYYQYAVDNMLSSQVDRMKIDWRAVKGYLEKDQTLITDFFKKN